MFKKPEPGAGPRLVLDTAQSLLGPGHCTICQKLLMPDHDQVIVGKNLNGRQSLYGFHRGCWTAYKKE
jgi:hypothetical protein